MKCQTSVRRGLRVGRLVGSFAIAALVASCEDSNPDGRELMAHMTVGRGSLHLSFPDFCVGDDGGTALDQVLSRSGCSDYFSDQFTVYTCEPGCIEEVVFNGIKLTEDDLRSRFGYRAPLADGPYSLEIRGCGTEAMFQGNVSDLLIDQPALTLTDLARTPTALRFGWTGAEPGGGVEIITATDEGESARCHVENDGSGDLPLDRVMVIGVSWEKPRAIIRPLGERRSRDGGWELLEQAWGEAHEISFRPTNPEPNSALWNVEGTGAATQGDLELEVEFAGHWNGGKLVDSLIIGSDGAPVEIKGREVTITLGSQIDRIELTRHGLTYVGETPHVEPVVPLQLTPLADERLQLQWTDVHLSEGPDRSLTFNEISVDAPLGIISRPLPE